MNYRDFYKKEQTLARPGQLSEKFDITKLSPKVRRGIEVELEHTPSKGKQLQDADARDIAKALKIAKDHFEEDAEYYTKLDKAGLEECGGREESYGGWTPVQPQLGLDIPSRIRPVSIVNLVNPVPAFGGKAVGMSDRPDTAVGSVAGDKEKITAAGEIDSSVAQKSVGGSITPNKGQVQAGPNHKGCIANTPKPGPSDKDSTKIGPNTTGGINGTPKNPTFGLKGSDLIRGGMGVTTDQSRLGQFEKKEHPLAQHMDGDEDLAAERDVNKRGVNVYDEMKDEEEVSLEQPEADDMEDANRREVDSMSAEKDSADEEEEGENVTINLNESIKSIVREVVNEAVAAARKKKPTQKPVVKPPVKRFKQGTLAKEATFISRKINEGRELTADERDIIREIILSKALRMKESIDASGVDYGEQGDQQSGILDAWIGDIVKYRSKTDTVEDLVSSIIGVAEDRLGIRHVDDEYVERRVRELITKIPAKY